MCDNLSLQQRTPPFRQWGVDRWVQWCGTQLQPAQTSAVTRAERLLCVAATQTFFF